MSRLPVPGSDDGTWGNVLNDYLTQSLNADGTLKTSAAASAGAEMSTNKGQPSGYAPLDGTGKVPAANLPAGSGGGVNTVTATNGTITIAGTTTNPTVGVGTISESQVTNLTTDLAAKAPVASPTFTGTVTLPADPTTGLQAATKQYVDTTASAGTPDATTTTKGKLQLAGDLGGTAASPTVPTKVSKAGDTMTGKLVVPSLQVTGGAGTGGQVLTSDASGNATWQAASGSGGSATLAGDSDVAVASPANNQVLTYNSTSSKWTNQAPAVSSVAGKTGAVTLAEADITNLTTDLAATEKTANKGTASGYAGLGANGYVPTAQLATGTADSSHFLRGDQTWGTIAGGSGNMSTATYDPAAINQQVVGTTATQALTNKTITDNGSNVRANSLKSASSTVDVSAATAPTAGQVLTATGSNAATWQAAPAGGSPITSQNQGTTLTTNTAQLNFTGSGVSASTSGNNVTVNIPGGGGSGGGLSWIDVTKAPYNADPTGATDSTAAINSAIAALRSGPAGAANYYNQQGGTIYFPRGFYTCSGGLDLRRATAITFRGDGGDTASGQVASKVGSQLSFTGGGTRTLSVTTTSGSTAVTGNFQISDTMCEISGAGIPTVDTTNDGYPRHPVLTNVVVGSSATLSMPATASGTATLTITSKRFIDGRSCNGVSILDMVIEYTNNAFTGNVVGFGFDYSLNLGPGDGFYVHVDNVAFSGYKTMDNTNNPHGSAAQFINLNKCDMCVIENSSFYGAQVCIVGKEAADPGFSNMNVVRSCAFKASAAAVRNPGLGWTIQGNVIEGLPGELGNGTNPQGGCVLVDDDWAPGAGAVVQGVSILGNVCNDDSNVVSNGWVISRGLIYSGLKISGNFFGGAGANLNFGAQVDGAMIDGNFFEVDPRRWYGATSTSGSTTITSGVTKWPTPLDVGLAIQGKGIAPGTTIVSVAADGSTATMSAAAGSGAGTDDFIIGQYVNINFAPYTSSTAVIAGNKMGGYNNPPTILGADTQLDIVIMGNSRRLPPPDVTGNNMTDAFDVGAHMVTTRSPNATPPSRVPTTVTLNAGSTDTAGVINIPSGGSSGLQVTITFGQIYVAAPKVTLTPACLEAAQALGYVSSVSTSAFAVSVANAPTGAMVFNYQVIG